MKRIFSIIIAFCFINVLFSQTEQSTFLIGGDINASIKNSKQYNIGQDFHVKELMAGIYPKCGYFFSKNFAAGLVCSYQYATYKTTQGLFHGNSESNIFSVGSFLRYYVPVKKIFIIGEVGYAYQKQIEKFTGNNSFDQIWNYKQKEHIHIFNFSIGISYFFNNNFSVEALIKYELSAQVNDDKKYTQPPKEETNDFRIEIGFLYYFNRTNNDVK